MLTAYCIIQELCGHICVAFRILISVFILNYCSAPEQKSINVAVGCDCRYFESHCCQCNLLDYALGFKAALNSTSVLAALLLNDT